MGRQKPSPINGAGRDPGFHSRCIGRVLPQAPHQQAFSESGSGGSSIFKPLLRSDAAGPSEGAVRGEPQLIAIQVKAIAHHPRRCRQLEISGLPAGVKGQTPLIPPGQRLDRIPHHSRDIAHADQMKQGNRDPGSGPQRQPVVAKVEKGVSSGSAPQSFGEHRRQQTVSRDHHRGILGSVLPAGLIGTWQHDQLNRFASSRQAGTISSDQGQTMPLFGQPLQHGSQSEFHAAAAAAAQSADRGAQQHQMQWSLAHAGCDSAGSQRRLR